MGNKDQIQDVDNPIVARIRCGFAELVSHLHQIQDVDLPIAVYIGGVFALEVDFAVEVGEQMGDVSFVAGDTD